MKEEVRGRRPQNPMEERMAEGVILGWGAEGGRRGEGAGGTGAGLATEQVCPWERFTLRPFRVGDLKLHPSWATAQTGPPLPPSLLFQRLLPALPPLSSSGPCPPFSGLAHTGVPLSLASHSLLGRKREVNLEALLRTGSPLGVEDRGGAKASGGSEVRLESGCAGKWEKPG